MDLDCVQPLTRIMDLCRAAGIGMIVRILPPSERDIGIKLLGIVHYRGKVKTLTVDNVSVTQNGWKYRAVFENGLGTAESQAARLAVPVAMARARAPTMALATPELRALVRGTIYRVAWPRLNRACMRAGPKPMSRAARAETSTAARPRDAPW